MSLFENLFSITCVYNQPINWLVPGPPSSHQPLGYENPKMLPSALHIQGWRFHWYGEPTVYPGAQFLGQKALLCLTFWEVPNFSTVATPFFVPINSAQRSVFSSYKDSNHWLRIHPNPGWSHLYLITSAMPLFPNKVTPGGGLGLEHTFLEAMIQSQEGVISFCIQEIEAAPENHN